MKRLYNHKTAKQVKIAGSGTIPYVDFLGKKIYILSTAVTSGATNPPSGSTVGDLFATTNATGRAGGFFTNNGTKLVSTGDGPGAQAAFVAALTGTPTGTANGALEAEGTVALSTSNTYSDSAVNTAVNTVIGKVENNVAEVATKLEAIRAALVAAGIMASS